MASVRLPGGAGTEAARARYVADRLIREHRVTAGVMLLNDAIWIRVSAQIYNKLDDYQRLSEVGKTLLI